MAYLNFLQAIYHVTEFASMPYEQTTINIYADSNNKASEPMSNRYYFMPFSKLDHKSAKIDSSPWAIQFQIEMWNDQLRDDVTRFISERIGYPGLRSSSQVSVLQFQSAQLVSPVVSSVFSVGQNNANQIYKNEKILWFTIVCSSTENAAKVLTDITSKPHLLLGNLKIRYLLPSSDFLEHRELPIKMEHVTGGEFMKQLIRRFPNINRAIILGPDRPDVVRENQLISQSYQAIVNPFSDQDKFMMTADSEFQLRELLTTNVMDFQHFRLNNDFKYSYTTPYDINYLYWEEENYRPDLIARKINIVYDRFNNTMKEEMVKAFQAAVLDKSVPNYFAFPGLVEVHQQMNEGPPTLNKLEAFFWKIERIIAWTTVLQVARFRVKWFGVTEINLPRILNPATYNGLKVNATFRAVLTCPLFIMDFSFLVSQFQAVEIRNRGTNLLNKCIETANFHIGSYLRNVAEDERNHGCIGGIGYRNCF